MATKYRTAVQAFRRKEILHAAIKEIGHRGLVRVTMDDCARAAGVAKGTLYLYFKDKNSLVASAIQWGFDRLRMEMEKIATQDLPVADKLRRMLIVQLSFFDSNRQLYRAFLEEKGRMCGNPKDPVWKKLKKSRRGYVEFIINVVKEGIDSQEFRKLSGERMGMVWVEMVGGMIVHRLTSSKLAPLEEDADFLLDLFLHGAFSNKRKVHG